MQSDLLVLVAGATLSLTMLGLGLSRSRRTALLEQRLAALTQSSQAVPQPLEDGTPRLDALLLCTGKDREEVMQALRAADYHNPRAVTYFAALRMGSTMLAGSGAWLLLASLGRLHGIATVYPFTAAASAFVFSKMLLRSRVKARARRIRKELPFLLDLILLMLESGVSLDQCFRHFVGSDAEALPHSKRVMEALVGDLGRGMAYETALERWADRMAVDGARELALLFRQTVLHGTELGPSLRYFVGEFAEKRVSSAREVIGRKTTQMTVVMIVFLMPALMIVISGPAVTSVMHTLKNMSRP
jgi:tight adherence protein C